MKAPAPAKLRRVRWEVSPALGIIGWIVIRNGHVKGRRFFKGRAVADAVEECNLELELSGVCSELLIKGRDGRIKDSRTYGDDPPEILG